MKTAAYGMIAVLWTTSAIAADLTKVDRSIGKEPAYQSKSPGYCLLVFGADAGEKKWMVFDGETLYFDRNGNGDLSEADEQIKAESQTIFSSLRSAGPLKYLNFQLNPAASKKDTAKKGTSETTDETAEDAADTAEGGQVILYRLNADYVPKSEAEIANYEVYKQHADLATIVMPSKVLGMQSARARSTAGPATAPVVQFDGPLTITLVGPNVLHPGEEADLVLSLITPGLGESAMTYASYQNVPADAHPVIEIEFQTPGGETNKLKFTLDKRC